MSRNWWSKFLFLVVVTIVAAIYVYPTIANIDPDKSKLPFKQKINLGLDLQGGLYMVLGVDFNKVFKDVLDRQVISLSDRLKDKGVTLSGTRPFTEGTAADDSHVIVNF